ncbi:unnamed protein product, partial [Brenthis ino]
MAPSTHPPCTPTASCQPIRCHPTPPPCRNPEKCLKKTSSKGLKPCRSAVSIMATRPKASCASCGKFGTKTSDPRNVKSVEKFLKEKSKEAKMKKKDRLKGTNSYANYMKKKAVYSTKSLKPCVSEASCSIHKHRPHPVPCAQPEKCYKKCIKKKGTCPSAMETISRQGSPCQSTLVESEVKCGCSIGNMSCLFQMGERARRAGGRAASGDTRCATLAPYTGFLLVT